MKRLLAAAAAALVLSACAAQPPAIAPSTAPTVSAAATPPADPGDGPLPFLDLTCAQLVPDDVVQAAMDDDAVERLDIARFRELSWFDEPEGSAVRQLGGFTCEWNNGTVEGNDQSDDAYRGIYVSVLPHAESERTVFRDFFGGGDVASYCGSGDYADHCNYDGLEGTTWLHVELRGAAKADPSGARDSVVAAVRAALASGEPNEPWEPPADSLPINLDCDALEPGVAAFFGREGELPDLGGGWSQEASSWSMAGILWTGCWWSYPVVEYSGSYVAVTHYAGSSWALAELVDAGVFDASTQFVTASMRESDAAWAHCPEPARCVLNMDVGHAWIQATVTLDAADAGMSGDELLRSLAEAVTAQVRSS